MPVRKIPLKYSSLSGVKNFKSSERSISFESGLEADYIELLEFDNSISHYEEQPYLIEYFYENKACTYTPDFLVHFIQHNKKSTIKPWLVEIKYTKDLIANKEKLKPKFNAANTFASELGYDFKILTEVDIRTPLLINAKFLNRYKFKEETIHEPKVDYIIKMINDLKTTTPNELIAACSKIKEQQAIYLYTLWYCMAKNCIGCDLQKPLNMNSKIWINA